MLTKRQQMVFEFIEAYIARHKIAPGLQVIADSLGLKSRANIHRIVGRLSDHGLLKTKPFKFYSIRLVDKSVSEIASL
tara:strand:- start:368 stop:601 length:234 start_codon:yes stop_codon:yes gene_type:complete